jgi:hypothetical protein
MLRETGIRNDGTDSFIVRFEMNGFYYYYFFFFFSFFLLLDTCLGAAQTQLRM